MSFSVTNTPIAGSSRSTSAPANAPDQATNLTPHVETAAAASSSEAASSGSQERVRQLTPVEASIDGRGRCDLLNKLFGAMSRQVWGWLSNTPQPTAGSGQCAEAASQVQLDPREALTKHFPNSFFGKEQWEQHLGPVGEEPPLPEGIMDIMTAKCPLSYKDEKVHETHMLVLIPRYVDGKPLGMKSVEQLSLGQHPTTSSAEHLSNGVTDVTQNVLSDQANPGSYWVLIKKKPTVSRNDYRYHMESMREHRIGDLRYDAPSMMENAVALLAFRALDPSPSLFSRTPEHRSDFGMVCRENPEDYPSIKRLLYRNDPILVLETDRRAGVRVNLVLDCDDEGYLTQPLLRFNRGEDWMRWAANDGSPLKALGLSYAEAAIDFAIEQQLTTVNLEGLKPCLGDIVRLITNNPRITRFTLSQSESAQLIEEFFTQTPDFQLLGRLCKLGLDINAPNDNLETALYRATPHHPAAVLGLLQNGADVNAVSNSPLGRDNWRHQPMRMVTPLHQAVVHNNIELTKLLLAYGADITLEDIDGSILSNRMTDVLADAPHPQVSRLINLCLRVIAKQHVDTPEWFPPMLLQADTDSDWAPKPDQE